MRCGNVRRLVIPLATVAVGLTAGTAWSGDQAQWGQYGSRNNVSAERDLPDWFDPGQVDRLDLAGMADGNDGPYKDEGRHMAASGQPPLVPGPRDADILWLYDMTAELGARPHNAANCSVLIDGDLLYVCTSNGVNASHSAVTNPAAPTLIVVDKNTGKLVAVDDMNLGDDIVHGQWGSPGLGFVNGRKQVFFGAGDGYIYGFAALDSAKISDKPTKLKTLWKLNGHPLAQTQDHIPIERDILLFRGDKRK